MNINKVAIILDHKLNHYRAPLFTALGDFFNVTVFHRGPKLDGTFDFEQKILRYKKVGPIEFVRKLDFISNFEIVVFMQNLRVINIYTAPLLNSKKKLLLWGIGTSSSKGLGSESMPSIIIRNLVTLMYQGLALYSSYPIENYWKNNRRKITVVGNSILNFQAVDTSQSKKEYFLFIGSLNKRKGIDELIKYFKQALIIHNDITLKIVGTGPELGLIEQQIQKLNLGDSIELLGAIHDSEVKKEIFEKAFCVISPFQAGLSVVESFSYGVPFVTSSTAITGGESQSIISEKNGVLFDDVSELSDIICSFVEGRRNSSQLGNNAYQFYQESLAFELYVKQFKKFIDSHI